jgi:TRAP-type C4-dicarboxylate transport system permease small subunit
MWLKTTASYLERILAPIMPSVGLIGSGVTALAMLLIVADVCGRRFFNQPITGTLEINEFMLIIITFCTIAFCQYIKGHVTIDLLVERLSRKTQNIIDSIIYVFYLIISVLLSWQLYLYAFTSIKQHTTSGTLLIPIYPFAFIAAIGCTLLCLVVLMHLFMYLSKVAEK